jgi:hypothetical protein
MDDATKGSPDVGLATRLVQRLVAPGVVDRRALRSAQARLYPARGAELVERLQRQAAPTAGARAALPLVRGTWSTPAELAGEGPPSRRAGAAPQLSENASASSAPGLVARMPLPRVTSARHAAALDATAPAIVNPRVMRSAVVSSAAKDPGRGTTTLGVVERPAPVVPSIPVVPDTSVVPSTPVGLSAGKDLRPGATILRMPGRPAVTRSADSVIRSATTGSVAGPGIPHVAQNDKRTGSPTAAPLVLRKPSNAARANITPPSTTPSTPAITTQPAASVIARTAAPNPAPVAHRAVPTPPHDIDWIAEQVGNRIARRLEIERERLGVRSWRP